MLDLSALDISAPTEEYERAVAAMVDQARAERRRAQIAAFLRWQFEIFWRLREPREGRV